jgi:2,3-bisphosphoglycerate-independent phosphoglycerate mutase
VLLILDGVGVGRGDEFDAVATSRTPSLDRLIARGCSRTLRAHGSAVGLATDGDMGNSEVGHNTMGAGRIYPQGANLVDGAIRSGRIWEGEWRSLIGQVTRSGSTLHLIGLLSDGDVHSSFDHLVAVLRRAAADGARRVRAHVLLDGRDVPDFTALDYVGQLEVELETLRRGAGCDARIASGGGRMTTTMDRYGANWNVVEAGWRAHVLGTARPFHQPSDAITTFRSEQPGVSDQYLPPFTVVDRDGRPIGPIEDGDAVLLFNFRGDRSIELAEALTEGGDFGHFDRGRVPHVAFASMVQYDTERGFPERFLVRPEQVPRTISELLTEAGVSQFACAETQKFGHVTYFWNGNRAESFDARLEDYLEIPSDRGPFEQHPEMKSAETAEAIVHALDMRRYSFLRANFAAGDMVGHTGNLAATRRAVEAIDAAVGRIADTTRQERGCLVVTADHGNAEDMVQRRNDGSPGTDGAGHVIAKTSHSTSPVRFVAEEYGGRSFGLRDDLPAAGLANVAATLLELLGFEPPAQYEPSLLSWSSRSELIRADVHRSPAGPRTGE